MLYPALKRVCDLVGAAVLAVLLAVPGVLVAVAIRLCMGKPVLFRQVRPGRHAKPFTVYKFRTMTEARDEAGRLLPDRFRLTRLGRFLRATSLDEIPQLWNVLRGDMSFVGPRPLLMRYLPYYTERERLRFAVPQGITGWAQVHGRNHVEWDDRLALDVWYVENRSLGLDLRILLMTVLAVLVRKGMEVDPQSAGGPDLDVLRRTQRKEPVDGRRSARSA